MSPFPKPSILLLGWLLCLPQAGFAVTEVEWETLSPAAADPIDDPFAEMPYEQLMALSLVASYRDAEAEIGSLNEVQEKELGEQLEKLDEWGVDADAMLRKREEIMQIRMEQAYATNPELDGEDLRLAGYMLPLEFNNEKITEFLLVPYVGACIHTPPPPPNQIVHVFSELGFATSDLYTPVWVEGTMKAEKRETNLSFVDGSSAIPVAYTLDANEVTPYQ